MLFMPATHVRMRRDCGRGSYSSSAAAASGAAALAAGFASSIAHADEESREAADVRTEGGRAYRREQLPRKHHNKPARNAG